MVGQTLQSQGFDKERIPKYFSVKEAVFPFNKFPSVDPILGPEMKSTGEVMGLGETFAEAYLKAQMGANEKLPKTGTVFISVREVDKPGIISVARDLVSMGFKVVATRGTAQVLEAAGIAAEVVNKVNEGRPHIVDQLKNGGVHLIINTTEGRQAVADSASIRRTALQRKVFYTTTLAGAEAVCQAMHFGEEKIVRRLQDIHQEFAV
jgi:carbamoyl-phosphate synthase large subunit